VDHYNSEWVSHPDYQVPLFWTNTIKWLTVPEPAKSDPDIHSVGSNSANRCEPRNFAGSLRESRIFGRWFPRQTSGVFATRASIAAMFQPAPTSASFFRMHGLVARFVRARGGRTMPKSILAVREHSSTQRKHSSPTASTHLREQLEAYQSGHQNWELINIPLRDDCTP